MMKAYVKKDKSPGFSLVLKDIPNDLASHEVLIKVLNVSLCGTDVHIYEWDNWAQKRIKPPLTIGHEFSGRVVKIGSEVSRVRIGDIVGSETHVVCGKCDFCRSGQGHICKDTKIIGVDIDGAFAEYIKMPEDNLFVDKSGLNPKYLSVLEPLGNAVHTVLHFNPVLKTVAVIGCGPIGLMGIDVLKAVGAKKIIAIETQKIRMNLARDLGADVVIDGLNEDVVKRVLEETNNEGVDLVCEFSGNSHALSLSLDYIKNGGNMSLLGIFKDNVNLDINKVVFKGLNIYGVTGRRMYESWQQIDSLLKTNKLHLDKVVTHHLDFNQMDEAFKIMEDKSCGKIVLSIKE